MAELDAELRGRLSRLAAAVPVSHGDLDPVHRGAVEARQRVRMAWATPLAVLAVGMLVAGVLRVGPFAPGASPDTGPVGASTRSGPFSLEILAAHGVVAAGEPIEAIAKLTYLGTESAVISHAFGAARSPVAFGIEEPIFGEHRLAPIWETACTTTTIVGADPLTVPFTKMAGSLDPMSTELAIFMHDPDLRLPPGTWHLYAVAWFTPGECRGVADSDATIEMRVEIPITVTGSLTPEPSIANPPQPTVAASAAANGPVSGVDDDGPYHLELQATKTDYQEFEPIDVVGALTYLGPAPVDVQQLALGFAIDEDVLGMTVSGSTHQRVCQDQSLDPGERFESPFLKGAAIHPDQPNAAVQQAFFDDPLLRLPPGRWHVRVTSTFTEGRCGGAVPDFGYRLEASIEVVVHRHVVDPRATEPPMRPPTPPFPDGSPVDIDRDEAFELQIHALSKTVRAGDPIELETSWRYIGSDPALIEAGSFQPEIAFSIEQLEVDAEVLRSKVYDSECTGKSMTSGIGREVALDDFNLLGIKAVSLPGGFDTLIADGIVSLLPGRYRITAGLSAYADGRCRGAVHDLAASVEIVVVSSTWTPVELLTASQPANACPLARGGGRLVPVPGLGVGVAREDGTGRGVRWPFGWSGWRDADGVVLLDEEGRVVAHEGDRVIFGGASVGDVFNACFGVAVVPEALPAEASEINLLTAPAPNTSAVCFLAIGGGRLVPNESSGLGVENADGDSESVRWPFGWSGWRVADSLWLVDPDGDLVARTGDVVGFSGGIDADGTFTVCEDVARVGVPVVD